MNEYILINLIEFFCIFFHRVSKNLMACPNCNLITSHKISMLAIITIFESFSCSTNRSTTTSPCWLWPSLSNSHRPFHPSAFRIPTRPAHTSTKRRPLSDGGPSEKVSIIKLILKSTILFHYTRSTNEMEFHSSDFLFVR